MPISLVCQDKLDKVPSVNFPHLSSITRRHSPSLKKLTNCTKLTGLLLKYLICFLFCRGWGWEPCQGSNICAPALKEWRPNHWIARQFPLICFLIDQFLDLFPEAYDHITENSKP